MRGARPDAECPRCSHRQPPTDDALVACAKCGLSYPPKELQHRVRRREPELPAVRPPTSIRIDEAGDTMKLSWTDNGRTGTLAIGASVILIPLVLTSDIGFSERIGYVMMLIALGVFGVFQSRRRPQLELDRDRVIGQTGSLALAEIASVDVQRTKVLITTRHGVTSQLVASQDPRDPEVRRRASSAADRQ